MKSSVMKCQNECKLPATWKVGTWWMCDVHVKKNGISAEDFDNGSGFTFLGTSRRLRQLATREDLSRSYFVGKVPDDIWVEVEV